MVCVVCLVCALARACEHACEQVRIANYIAGGVLDNTWRSVVIPLSALATTAWNLGDVETLSFGNITTGQYLVQGIFLQVLGQPSVRRPPWRARVRLLQSGFKGARCIVVGSTIQATLVV